MAKIVLDANVLISAFLRSYSPPDKIIRLAREKRYSMAVCAEILLETSRALLEYERIIKKYNYSAEDVKEYFSTLLEFMEVVVIPASIPKVCRDPNDDMVLACALESEADFIVTRDKDLLVLREYKRIKILTPEKFITYKAR